MSLAPAGRVGTAFGEYLGGLGQRLGFGGRKAALEGGAVAGNARRELEEKSGTKVSIRENYKELSENKRKALKKDKSED